MGQGQTLPAVLPAVLPAETTDGKGQVRKWGMKMALEGGGAKRRQSSQKSLAQGRGASWQADVGSSPFSLKLLE